MKRIRSKINIITVLMLITCSNQVKSQNIGWKTNPLTQKELPVEPGKMPDYLWQRVKEDPFTKKHLGWKLAYIQHPMYLLIDEDRGVPPVGERVPPWGAENASAYAARVRRNLHSLDQFSELRLNYQWSATELKSITEQFPDVLEGMKKHYGNGSLDFVDGTYSQAHLQVLGSESNWRQFEYGLQVYRDLFNKKIEIYARQETGLHLQIPQLLKLFDYQFAYLPTFPHVVEFTEGNMEFLCSGGRYQPIGGSEFIKALGLDGTTIPTYMKQHARDENDWKNHYQKDLYGGGRLWSDVPDLDEVDQAKFDKYHSLFDFVLLGDELGERYMDVPPRAKAKIYSYWSYMEGVWAEELMRVNKKAEENVVLTEELTSMGMLAGLASDYSIKIKDFWSTILKAQHHDISWIEVTDLRRQSIIRNEAAISDSKKLMLEISGQMLQKERGSMAVVNGLPYERSCLIALEGSGALGSKSDFQEYNGRSFGFVTAPAGGFRGYKLLNGSLSSSKQSKLPAEIITDFYKVEVSPEGLMKQLTTSNGKKLLNAEDYLGGEIRARMDDEWVDNRSVKSSYYSGPVFDIIERSGFLGEIQVTESYYFFRERPVIKVELEFNFTGNEVGNMWIDQSKINIYYPTKGFETYQDIPFGYIEAKQNKPLFATNWVYANGLVYINRGTTKHWIEEGTLANVVAWGSNHFTNRMHWDWWASRPQYDLRLYGNQKIEYYLIPYDEFNAAQVIHDVDDITAPVCIAPGTGERSFYRIENKDLKVTTIYPKEGELWIRGYKIPSVGKSAFRDFEIFNSKLSDLHKTIVTPNGTP